MPQSAGPPMSYPAAADASPTPRLTPAVKGLVAACAAVFFIQVTTFIGAADMHRWLGFSLTTIGERWWTPVTYMFVHGGFWHLALNMYVLLLFGSRVERAWSSGEFVRYYLLCGFGGLLLQVLFFRDSLLIGASAAVYGVMLAFARRWPDEVVYLFAVIPIKVRWLVLALAVMSLVSGIAATSDVGSTTNVAHLAHFGGFLTGWLYLRMFAITDGQRLRPRIAALPDTPDETPRAVPRGPLRPREKPDDEVDEIVQRSRAAVANNRPGFPVATQPRPAEPRTPAMDLDLLLDKISQHGIDSLTGEERRLLDEVSRKLQDGRNAD